MVYDPLSKMAAVRVADRRLEVRYEGSINGSYTLSSRRPGGVVQVFACRTQGISPSAVSVTAPVLGDIGEPITARLDGLGIVRGEIERHLDHGFVFTIAASPDQRKKLAAKIEALRRRSHAAATEKRAYRRQQPVDPRSVLTLPDGTLMRCFVIDFSRSGAAISADYAPEIGARLVIGALAARVVRHLEVGFSVQFEAVQDAEGLDALLTGFEAKLTATPEAPIPPPQVPTAALA